MVFFFQNMFLVFKNNQSTVNQKTIKIKLFSHNGGKELHFTKMEKKKNKKRHWMLLMYVLSNIWIMTYEFACNRPNDAKLTFSLTISSQKRHFPFFFLFLFSFF